MKQYDFCPWCKKTKAIVPIEQGGVIHTCCEECGSKGPLIHTQEMRISYIEMRNEVKEAVKALDLVLSSQSSPNKELRLHELKTMRNNFLKILI